MYKLIKFERFAFDADLDKYHLVSKREEFFLREFRNVKTKLFELPKECIKFGRFDFKGEHFSCIPASFGEIAGNFKRGAQLVTQKDAGLIIAQTGISKDSVVLDAGVGSGALAGFLSRVVSRVDSFDINDAHLEIARKNLKNVNNVVIAKGDVYQDIFENDYDLITLDVPEPWKALANIEGNIKLGGYVVTYSPHISQVQKSKLEAPNSLMFEECFEIILRSWKVSKVALRPLTRDHQHTAFLSFFRKVE